MSLLGIDVGTTGCKAVVFSEEGTALSSAYVEYDVARRLPGYAELDSEEVWHKIKSTIARAAHEAGSGDRIKALSVASMGEAVVPVSKERHILGPSILIIDERGSEYVEDLRLRIDDERCYAISGNAIGNQFGLTKLMWLRDHEPALYERADLFLNWSGFVAYMLGAEPSVDYSLANRMLLFDLSRRDWSDELIRVARLDRSKLPSCSASGTPIGSVDGAVAEEIGIAPGTLIAAGAHDQCANAVGSGSLRPGTAMYGMGTFPTIVPVFDRRPEGSKMIPLGLNTEHHAAGGRFVSFIYHMGGSIVKWYRDTFAAEEQRRAAAAGLDIYPQLFDELPGEPGPLIVLPHFAPMGPPDFLSDSSGVVVGLTTSTRREEVLRAILEGNNFAHRMTVERLDEVGISLEALRAVGGGSRSDTACRICADILDCPVVRPDIPEAGALGAAMLAGLAAGAYSSLDETVERSTTVETLFEPDPARVEVYNGLYERYLRLRRLTLDFTREWTSWNNTRPR